MSVCGEVEAGCRSCPDFVNVSMGPLVGVPVLPLLVFLEVRCEYIDDFLRDGMGYYFFGSCELCDPRLISRPRE